MGELDRAALLWVVEHRVGVLDPLFIGLSLIGTVGIIWIVLAPLAAFLGGRAPLRASALTAAAVWSTDLATQGLKVIVGRPRPSMALPQVDPLVSGVAGSSFPSGHAATSAAGAICLSLLLPKALPAFAALASGIAFSRVYVGVHYPGDVVAGLVLGTAFGLLMIALSKSSQHRVWPWERSGQRSSDERRRGRRE